MKIYRLILPDGSKLEKAFTNKREAANAMYAYISNHPLSGYNPFDFQLKEECPAPTDIISYTVARDVLGAVELSKIAVDDENKEILGTFDFLLTMARAWNKADGFDPNVDGLCGVFYPSFKVDELIKLWSNKPLYEALADFTISHLISFRTEELARAFADTFMLQFQKLLKNPYS